VKVLVDTPIWSYALRSNCKGFEKQVSKLESLIFDQRVLIMGPIRQEVLSGYSDMRQFEKLREKLSYFENVPIAEADYVEAARLSNLCRQKGIQGSHTDFLICAVSIRLEAEIFTSDQDFSFYQKHIPIKQHQV